MSFETFNNAVEREDVYNSSIERNVSAVKQAVTKLKLQSVFFLDQCAFVFKITGLTLH